MFQLLISILGFLIIGGAVLINVIGIIKLLGATDGANGEAIKKGRAGEQEIIRHLSTIPDTYVLNNVYLPLNKEGTKHTEIDVIAVNKAGIYVIESKNYSGRITGKKEDEYWFQCLPGKANRLYNPLKQNRTHCKALRYRLMKYGNMIKSLAVFGDGADISAVCDRYSDEKVISCFNVYDTIMEDMGRCTNYLSSQDIKLIADELYKYTNVSEEVKRNHINNIKSRYR